MKKLSFIPLLLLTLCMQQATAQVVVPDTRTDLVFGLKAGINGSNVWDEQGQSFRADPKVGFVGGGYLGIPIGKYLGVQPELLFSQKGFKATDVILNSKYTLTRTTSHIDVPVLIQFKPVEFITILGGPVYSYLLSQRNVFVWENTALEREQEFENDNIRRNRLGLMFGGDVVVAPMVIGARAGWDLQQNNGDGSSSTPRYKNQWLQLTLGYQF
ncbi:porin family protein [Nemorincola caseinilytica]|uniref:porin family protein n=1 Tax=Nemorincola caseinilytica TaxID=2054315 RepID=UPI0031E8298C